MFLNALDLLKDFSKSWLVVGKGPTSEKVKNFSTDIVNILTLNHAFRLATPSAALFIDREAFAECFDELKAKNIKVILPWRPHQNSKSGKDSLDALFSISAYWKQYAEAGNVYTFNSTTSSLKPNPDYPIIRVRYFSAVAAINLLVAAGHTEEIYTLGVDGGTRYNPAFDTKDRLSNGRSSFDIQFDEFEKTVKSSGVRIVKL